MKQSSFMVAVGVLASVASAVPFGQYVKRDIRWVVETKDVVFTEIAWATEWVDWQAPAATGAAHVPVPAVSSLSSVAAGTTTASIVVATTAPAIVAPTSTTPAVTPASSVASIVVVSSAAAPAASTSTAVVVAASTTTAALSASTTTPSSVAANGITSGPAEDGTTYTGDITYFADGLGSCGVTSGPDDHIVAISHILMDDADYYTANPNLNPLCNKQVIIQYGGSTFPATVVDRCTGCAEADLDLSEGFFSLVTDGDTAAGRISGVTWSWA